MLRVPEGYTQIPVEKQGLLVMKYLNEAPRTKVSPENFQSLKPEIVYVFVKPGNLSMIYLGELSGRETLLYAEEYTKPGIFHSLKAFEMKGDSVVYHAGGDWFGFGLIELCLAIVASLFIYILW